MKRAMIFGDSYSTFEGCIPDGYAVYYGRDGLDSDVTSEKNTWWYPLTEECGITFVRNDSWSGSTVCYTGYEGVDCSESSSFIYRLRTLKQAGFFRDNEIDTVFVFGGTNDSWADAPIGELQFDGWEKEDLYAVLPAVCCFLSELKESLPRANIICIVNSGLKDEIANGLQAAAEHYGVKSVMLCGIDKQNNHPTVKGMQQIKEQVKALLGE